MITEEFLKEHEVVVEPGVARMLGFTETSDSGRFNLKNPLGKLRRSSEEEQLISAGALKGEE
jgi:hypothetical protein